ncbi:MAG: RHS repeat-associated core domain-containing protein [Verrucomicrobia bacterium]|nr:RHS repeat-associated core domain-containing protein [Verrucomicrobiota bacterium]
MNRRLGKTVSGNTTRFLYNQDDSWADIDGANGLIARYLHGARIDELLARQRATDGRGWHLTDRLGTVRDIANAAGTVVTHLDYKTFGQPLNAEDRISRFLFVGREYDLELGMYFYRTRFFDAQLGKFISEDSLRFESGDLNLYRYAANSPAIHTDPFGTSIVEEAAISRWIVIPTTAYIGVKIYIICQGVKGEKITIGGVIESAAFGGLGGITGATFTTLSIYLIGGNLGPIIVCSITDHL